MKNKLSCSCILCKNEITTNQLPIHYGSKQCLTGKLFRDSRTKDRSLQCYYCDFIGKNNNSISQHEMYCKLNPDKQAKTPSYGMCGKQGSNQFIKAKSLGIEVYGKQSQEAKEKISKVNKERGQTLEAKKRLSRIAKERGLGGHTSKQRLYFKKNNGDVIYLQSSYEIKFAKLLEEMNINWSRPAPLIWVDEEGNDHRYYADFKIGEKFFDTKNNYLAVKDADKVNRVSKQNNVIVKIVTHENICREFIENALLV